MKFQIILFTIITSNYFTRGQITYEWVFQDEEIFVPCGKYPDKFLDQLFDVSNINYGTTEDGSVVINGYVLMLKTVKGPQPLSVELFKKERGTWQPTTFNQKRVDTCTACYSKMEIWHSYLKNTPKEQLACPFTLGQRVDFNISQPTYVSVPYRYIEGEYRVNIRVGSEYGDFFICVDVFATLYKI